MQSPSPQPRSEPAIPPAAAVAPAARANGRGAPLRAPGWMVTVLVVLVALAYGKSLGGELVYDDLALVARNPAITSFENFGSFFTSSYWDFLDPREAKDVAYWRPLTSVYLATGWALGGGRPLPFHALSLAMHVLATAVAFRLVLRLTRRAGTAFWTALLFGLHPLHVESVAWISAVNDPLYGLFALLALALFLRWRDRGSRGVPWPACLAFALGLLAKELAAATILLVALVDLARLPFRDESAEERNREAPRSSSPGGWGWRWSEPGFARRFQPFTRAYAPLLTVLGLYLLARVFVFGELTAGFGRTVTHYAFDDPLRLVKLRVEILGGGLALLAWPSKLALFREVVPVMRWSDPRLLGALAATAALALTAVLAARRGARFALAAALAIPLALLPALLRPEALGRFPLSDRFFYLSALGFALLATLAAARFLPAALAGIVLALVAGGYAAKSYARIDVWHDELALFEAAKEESPLSPYVRWGLGRVHLDRFRETRDIEELERALAEFEGANDLLTRAKEPDNEEIFFDWNDRLQANLGTATCYLLAAPLDPLHDFGTPEAAFELITKNFPASHHAWVGLGEARLGQGDLSGAGQALERALQLNERHPGTHFYLGELYSKEENWALAKQHYERALELIPGDLSCLVALANLEFHHGDPERGVAYAEEARERYPGEAEPLRILGVMAAAKGDYQVALRRLDGALELDPENGRAHLERGKVLYGMGEPEGAIAELRRACDRLRDDFEAHYNLGVLLLQNGAVDAAMPFLERAYSIGGDRNAMRSLRDQFLKVRGQSVPALIGLARVDLQRGSLLEANIWIDAAMKLEPGNPIVHYLRGRIQRESGLLEAAVASQLRSLEIHEENFQAQFELGDLLAELERWDESLLHLRRAREIGVPESWSEGLVRTTEKRVKKRIEEAEAALEEAHAAGAGGE